MKKTVFMALAAILMVACQPKQPVLTAGEFAQKAPELVNQTIILKGTAIHVCERSGMKLFLADSMESDDIVNVMAAEGQNKFDPETIGKNYAVKGIVRAVIIEPAEEEAEEECATDSCATDSCSEAKVQAAEGHECETDEKARKNMGDTFYYVENISYTVEE